MEKKREGEREGGREESSRQADGTIVLGLPDSGGRDVVLPKEILTGVHRDHKAAPNIGLQSTACAGEYGRKSKENSKKGQYVGEELLSLLQDVLKLHQFKVVFVQGLLVLVQLRNFGLEGAELVLKKRKKKIEEIRPQAQGRTPRRDDAPPTRPAAEH